MNFANQLGMNKIKKSKKVKLKIILILVGIIAVIYLMKFSIDQYKEKAGAIGIVICNEQECIKTLHIHSNIEFNFCGKTLTLPRETGPLDGLHTHKEKNRLHFHNKVQLDPDSKVQLFDKRLSIQEVIETFELEKESGALCEGVVEKNQNPTVTVNGIEKTLEYNWRDGDEIELTYGG